MRCWVAAAVPQRSLVPEGVGLFSERDWHSSPYVSWELLVKLDSALSTTIKAVPTHSLHSSELPGAKPQQRSSAVFFLFTVAPAPKSGVCPCSATATKGWGDRAQTRQKYSSTKQHNAEGSASPWACGQAPVLVANCLNNSNKSLLWRSECIPPLDLICMVRTGCWKEEQGLNYPVTLLNLSLWMEREREWNACLQGGAEW